MLKKTQGGTNITCGALSPLPLTRAGHQWTRPDAVGALRDSHTLLVFYWGREDWSGWGQHWGKIHVEVAYHDVRIAGLRREIYAKFSLEGRNNSRLSVR